MKQLRVCNGKGEIRDHTVVLANAHGKVDVQCLSSMAYIINVKSYIMQTK